METLLSAVAMMRPNYFYGLNRFKRCLLLSSCYTEDYKYLKFQWNSQYYKYTVSKNGLCSCPRQFTKLMKPVCSTLW